MAQNHYTADEWDAYVRANFGTVGDAERWRNTNNIFVDGLPTPRYTGPRSDGNKTPPLTQGIKPVDPEDTGALNAVQQYFSANPDTGTGGSFDLGDFYRQQQQLMRDDAAALDQGRLNRKAQFDEATKAIKERRYGPTRTEELLQLAAAIGKPMIRPSFGGVMANVLPALADMETAKRTADQQRAEALLALKQTYMTGEQGAEAGSLEARRKMLALMSPVVAAQAKGQHLRTGFNPVTGVLTDLDTNEPIPEPQVPTLTPQQAAAWARDPRNRGRRFRTTDGREMEIK